MHNPIIVILAAGLAGWLVGAVWYTSLGKPWQRALGLDPEACKGKPMPKAREELLDENAQLQNRIRDLEESQKTTNALLARLSAQLDAKEGKPAPVAEAPKREAAANAGAAKPK
jgi:hypothetical protein